MQVGGLSGLSGLRFVYRKESTRGIRLDVEVPRPLQNSDSSSRYLHV